MNYKYRVTKEKAQREVNRLAEQIAEVEAIIEAYEYMAIVNREEGEKIEALEIRAILADFIRPMRKLKREIEYIGQMED